MSQDSTFEGAWPGGWIISALAGVIAAILARWLGDTAVGAAALLGAVVFLVFGVLLGMFWTEPATGPADHRHGHDAHGHDAHGHDGQANEAARSKDHG